MPAGMRMCVCLSLNLSRSIPFTPEHTSIFYFFLVLIFTFVPWGHCTIQLVSFAGVLFLFSFYFCLFFPPLFFFSPLFLSCCSGYLLWRVFVSCFSLLGVSFTGHFPGFHIRMLPPEFSFPIYFLLQGKSGMCTRGVRPHCFWKLQARPLGVSVWAMRNLSR